jgi:acyl-CoA hydrolase
MTEPKPPSRSQVEMTQLVLPSDSNNQGTAFGGRILAWIDIAAAVAAGRHSGGPVVTASMDSVHFIRPIRKGHVVVLKARVNYVGRSSMEVGVRVEGEQWGGGHYHALTAYTTFVALGEDGSPRPAPKLILEEADDERRFEDGRLRMEQRREQRRLRVERLD